MAFNAYLNHCKHQGTSDENTELRCQSALSHPNYEGSRKEVSEGTKSHMASNLTTSLSQHKFAESSIHIRSGILFLLILYLTTQLCVL